MSGGYPAEAQSIRLAALQWWHLPEVMTLEAELFGAEQWSQELFWSELALCAPTLDEPPTRRYVAALGPTAPGATAPGATASGATASGVTGTEQLVGYAGLATSDNEAFVQTIGVAGNAQRRGVGSRLLTTMLDTARETGCTVCWLEVRADNAAAQSVYRRFGFVQRGVRRGYYQPSGTDALVLAAPLGAAPRGAGAAR